MAGEKKTSFLYTTIAVLFTTSTCCLIALIVMLIRDAQKQKPSEDPIVPPELKREYCLSDTCRKAATSILFSINRKVDPCEDFYEYACGLWSPLHPIVEGYGRRTAFTELNDQNAADLKQYMEGLQTKDDLDVVNKLLKQVYETCMNEEAIESIGADPLMEMMSNVFANSPEKMDILSMIKESDKNLLPLEKVLAKTWKQFGTSIIVTTTIGADENSTAPNYILHLDQAPLSLGSHSEDYYLKNDSSYVQLRSSYLNLIQIGISLYANESSAKQTQFNVGSLPNEVLEFEIQLAKINLPSDKRRNPSDMFHKMTVDQLETFGTNFNWTIYLGSLSPNIDAVNVAVPAYFESLNKLLQDTSKQTVYSYVLWRLMFSRFALLPKKYSNLYYEFMKVFRDQEKEKNRSKFCLQYVVGEPDDGSDYMGYAIGRLFVENKGFNQSSRTAVEDMVTALQEAFRRLLVNNSWMDTMTKQKAHIKSAEMISSIGYPDMLNTLTEYYQPLLKKMDDFDDLVVLEKDAFFQVNSKIVAWHNQRDLNKLNKPFDRKTFGGSPAIVNAWYCPTKNSIVFPAGILQPPFFHEAAPVAINFGSIGTVIGHEITHGFDDEGSQYNGVGKLENWWSMESAVAFKERVQCIADQYSGFCYPELGEKVCVKGKNTQGENIADNGGIKQSFSAYKEMTINMTEQMLPGLELYSMDQIFFLSFANFWCANFRDNYLKNMLETNAHAPGRDRVIGTLQNFEQFAQSFKCRKGSRMNPNVKCAVW